MTTAATTVRAPGTGVFTCPRCGEPHAREDWLALHLGRAHADALTPEERARFETALADEDAWLAMFRKHVRGGLNALPALVIYLLILLMTFVSGIPWFFGFVLLPGALGFGAMMYYLGYANERKGS